MSKKPLHIRLPDVKSLLKQTLDVKVKEDNRTATVGEWVEDNVNVIRNMKKKSDDYQFAHFLCELLRRGGREMKEETKFKESFRLNMVPEINLMNVRPKVRKSEALIAKLREKAKGQDIERLLKIVEGSEYAFGAGVALWVIIGAKYVVYHRYGGLKNYLEEAERNIEDGFKKDKLFKILFIGNKVRDVALSLFNENYLGVDVRIMGVLFRTGLVCYSYYFGIQIPKYELPSDYLEIRSLCYKLAEEADITPFRFDRIMWHFGGFCVSSYKNCKICPVTECLQKTKRLSN